jgi:hypothetical protein
MDPAAEARVLVCAGVQGGRRNEITRVLVNAYVVGSTNTYRTYQDGEPYKDGACECKDRTVRTGPSRM